jgi:hypothetical protein
VDPQERRVFARNTAPSTEVCSSRTELGVKCDVRRVGVEEEFRPSVQLFYLVFLLFPIKFEREW